MSATAERELKLEADADFTLPEFPGEPLAERTFISTYHDTPDMRLAKAGIILRRRVEHESVAWQLKLPRGRRRVELELPGDREAVPMEITELLFAHARGAAVAPVVALRTTRGGVAVHDGSRRVADVISDVVDVLDGEIVTASAGDLEIELVDGDEEALRAIEQQLRDAGARDADRRSKLQRALDLAPPEPPEMSDNPSPAERLQAVVTTQYRAILANDPGTRLGADAEHLHQHRVAVRRLRSVLRAAAPMLDPTWTKTARDELRWAGYALGPVRDLDVLIAHLRAEIATLPAFGSDDPESVGAGPLIDALDREHGRAREAMLEALRSDRYLDLLDLLEAAAVAVPITDPDVSLRKLARKEFRKLERSMDALGPLPTDEAVHAARIKVKRLRYTAELAAPFGGEELERVVAETRSLQDLLGDHQDAHVAEERIRTLLATPLPADTHLAGGRLIERERIRRRTIRRELPAAWEALANAGREAFR
jgi:CHAD domain-containing protein